MTGYAPFGNIAPTAETCKKYDKQAEQINNDNSFSYDEKQLKVQDLFDSFMNNVLTDAGKQN